MPTPLRVARSALQNGASVAGLLLTTNTLVAEEQTPWGGSPALMTEFGAGAALFANGQVMAAEREGRAAFADYRSAHLGAIGRAPTGDDLEITVPAAPARLAHR